MTLFISDKELECSPYESFAIVSQLKLARGFSLSDQGEAMMPISGKGEILTLYAFL